jgi:hypothetical protein
VISAKHGLIDSEQLLADYDERLVPAAADRIRSEALVRLSQIDLDYDQVLISTSRAYEVVTAGVERCFPEPTTVMRTRGPRGKQLAQLRNWLEGKPLGLDLPERHFPQRGIARLKGIERTLQPDQLLELAREWLAEDRTSKTRSPWKFTDRYVLIDGERVAPKWLVGRLFELPVKKFETPAATRVLEQLGLPVHSLQRATSRETLEGEQA